MFARKNPFRTEQVSKIRYYLTDQEFERLLERWRASGMRAAIVGPEGSGKTTLLEDISQRLARQGMSTCWLRFRGDDRPHNHDVVQTILRRSPLPAVYCI